MSPSSPSSSSRLAPRAWRSRWLARLTSRSAPSLSASRPSVGTNTSGRGGSPGPPAGRGRPRRRQKRSKTASYVGRSSCRRTKIAAPAARTTSRCPMSTSARARAKSIAPPRSIGSPAALSSRPKRTEAASSASPETRSVASLMGTDLREVAPRRLALHPTNVLFVLEDDAQGLVDQFGAQLGLAQREERGRPVERLRDARNLREVGLAQALHEAHDLRGQSLGRVGHANPHDLDFPGQGRVVDPVVEAAPLE